MRGLPGVDALVAGHLDRPRGAGVGDDDISSPSTRDPHLGVDQLMRDRVGDPADS